MQPSPFPVEEFRAECLERGHKTLLRTCVVASVILPPFSLHDWLVYRRVFWPLLAVRMACVALAGFVWLLGRSRWGRRQSELLQVLLLSGIAAGIGGVPVYLLGYASPYFTSSIVLLAAAGIFFLWSPLQAALVSAAVLLSYTGGSLAAGGIADWQDFAARLTAIAAMAVLVVLSVHFRARAQREEFLVRRELRAALEEKSVLLSDLEGQARRLRDLNRDMEDLLYLVSHDLRAPLINIQGFAREIAESLGSWENGSGAAEVRKEIEESLGFVFAGVERMEGLVRALLQVCRAGTRTDPTQVVDLDAVVRDVLSSLRYQLESGGFELVKASLPTVRGDPVALGQVFANLVDNAVKYGRASGIRRIEIGVENGTLPPRFFVRDSGPGIPPEHVEEIFRLHRRLSSESPGEGLGLAAVRKIVERHGGRIWVESKPGEGTTFWFTLEPEHAPRAGARERTRREGDR
ncbi:MAG: hypothetical protein KatS3mg076_0149 [Candidatus Binatia bacterium]|nr:MAG: hypothetical protein KatS3mg076_0149 [Candidatus Binatia bacterium]